VSAVFSNLFDGIDDGNGEQGSAALLGLVNDGLDFIDADKRTHRVMNGDDRGIRIHVLHGSSYGILPARAALHN
jgi:hypothetical protein